MRTAVVLVQDQIDTDRENGDHLVMTLDSLTGINKQMFDYALACDLDGLIEYMETVDGPINPRTIVSMVRNMLGPLETFMAAMADLEIYIGLGSYHFRGIDNLGTFDIYHQYDSFLNCPEDLPQDQMDYITNKGYVLTDEFGVNLKTSLILQMTLDQRLGEEDDLCSQCN